jgi:hypothetical protein
VLLSGLGELSPEEERIVRERAKAQFRREANVMYGPPPPPPPKPKARRKKPKPKPKPGAVAKAVNDVAAAVITPGAKAKSKPIPKWVGYAGLAAALAGAVFLLGGMRSGGGGRRVVRNPRRRRRRSGGRKTRRRREVVSNPRRLTHHDPDVQRAIDFREEFHWGYPAKKVIRRKVSPIPRVLVQLGKVDAIQYETKKKGERAQLFFHEFEDRKPDLCMDVKNKRLHVVGGSYTVTADGITG